MPAKKKKKKDDTRNIIAEYDGWKAGDMAWGKTFRTGKIVYGEVKEFYPDDLQGPAVMLFEVTGGFFITVLVSTLTEKDPKKTKIKKKKKIRATK